MLKKLGIAKDGVRNRIGFFLAIHRLLQHSSEKGKEVMVIAILYTRLLTLFYKH